MSDFAVICSAGLPASQERDGVGRFRPDRLHVDTLRYVNAIGILVRLAFGIGHCFLKAAPDTVRDFVHGFVLLTLIKAWLQEKLRTRGLALDPTGVAHEMTVASLAM